MRSMSCPHQYVARNSNLIVTEEPIGDRFINFLYNSMRDSVPAMFKALTSKRMSSLLGFCQYDLLGTTGLTKVRSEKRFAGIGVDWDECVEPRSFYTSYRKLFERQIRYWHVRPIDSNIRAIASPADSRIIIGSFDTTSSLHLKGSFFDLPELIGQECSWLKRFRGGAFTVCRLTPEKYHYNHVPVSGRVVDTYTLDGSYHSCNPSATIAIASLYSKNRRVVTIIDTDVEGGTQVGLVAMIEIVALMIGDIQQAYSQDQYTDPQDVRPGMFVEKGQPKSLFRPGSSTDVLLFEPGRIRFSEDLVHNSKRVDVQSRFSEIYGKPLVETDVLVRSTIGEAVWPKLEH